MGDLMNDWPLWVVVTGYRNPPWLVLSGEPRVVTEVSHVRAPSPEEARKAITRWNGFREDTLIDTNVSPFVPS